jgi:hypothetical protein
MAESSAPNARAKDIARSLVANRPDQGNDSSDPGAKEVGRLNVDRLLPLPSR